MVTENTAPNAAADVEMSQYVADRTRVNEDKIKKDDEIISQFGDYNYGWHDSDAAGEAAKRGIDENVVRAISADKGEPQWMLDMRLLQRRRLQVLRQANRQAGEKLGRTA